MEELTIPVKGRVDTNNAAEFEAAVVKEIGENPGKSVVLDIGGLDYISSAGLRALLRINKSAKKGLTVVNAIPEVYEIFNVTGFTDILNIKRAMREVSVKGCEFIGGGANGRVYRIDPETVVKVFSPLMPLEHVEKELRNARKSFVYGLPTALSYDTVRVGESYGAVYELLEADTFIQVLKDHPERAAELAKMTAELFKKLHTTKVDSEGFDFLKERYLGYLDLDEIRSHLSDEEYGLLKETIERIPDTKTLTHGAMHIGNLMLQNDEVLLIDMGEIGIGHPIFDFIGPYTFQYGVGKEFAEQITGLPFDVLETYWLAFLQEYFGTDDQEKLDEINNIMEAYAELRQIFTPALVTMITGDRLNQMYERVKSKLFPDKIKKLPDMLKIFQP